MTASPEQAKINSQRLINTSHNVRKCFATRHLATGTAPVRIGSFGVLMALQRAARH